MSPEIPTFSPRLRIEREFASFRREPDAPVGDLADEPGAYEGASR